MIPTASETSPQPIIAFQGVHKSIAGLKVLDGIDLRIDAGEKVALMGTSGCGKTTLLRCVNALETVDQGTLIVNGHTLGRDAIELNRFRSRIGMVFQQFNLFPHLTVLENIMLAPVKVLKLPKTQVRQQALGLLERVGIPDKADSYPDRLSGGQKQRVAIARSLAMTPELLLLDEPTSALDPPVRHEVLRVIEDVARDGMTIVMVTHEIGFAKRMADRLIMMDRGRIVESGPPQSLLQQPREEATRQYLAALAD